MFPEVSFMHAKIMFMHTLTYWSTNTNNTSAYACKAQLEILFMHAKIVLTHKPTYSSTNRDNTGADDCEAQL